jgi:glycosyltransferase involved in cell wall biosynthesis
MAAQKNRNTQIVVLPSWYPNRLDRFAGDFIQRHVSAISALRFQYIIYVVKDEYATITKKVFEDTIETDRFIEKIIYYHPTKTGIKIIDKLLSQLKRNQLYFRALQEYVKSHGIPALIHVHVVLNAGLIALWAKRKWKIPYVISEHWSVFLEEANYQVKDLPFLYQESVKKILKNSIALSTVSKRLGEAISQKYQAPAYTVIPNVVDHSIFYPADHNPGDTLQFIHASSMVNEKNVETIIGAFAILKEKHCNAILHLYGPAPAALELLTQKLDLQDRIFFWGSVDQQTLAGKMQESDALLLYSKFETFGCVLIEANATGTPVIVSELPVFHELVTEKFNGVFVEGNNSKALADQLMDFRNTRKNFDKNQIVQSTNKYSFTAVARQFDELYSQVLAGKM